MVLKKKMEGNNRDKGKEKNIQNCFSDSLKAKRCNIPWRMSTFVKLFENIHDYHP